MPKIEEKLAALTSLIDAAVAVEVARNEALPTKVPAAGLVLIEDGDPGTPIETTFPLTKWYDHPVPVRIYCQRNNGRETTIAGIKAAIGTAIESDRTLGGRVDYMDADTTETDELPVDGATPVRMEVVTVTLSYGVTNPLT